MKSFMGAVLLIAGAAGQGAMQDKHSSIRFEERKKEFDAAAIAERAARSSIVMLASAPSDMDFASMKRELEAAEKKEEIARNNMKRAETQMKAEAEAENRKATKIAQGVDDILNNAKGIKAEEVSEKREAARMRESESQMQDLDHDDGKPSQTNYAPPRRRRAVSYTPPRRRAKPVPAYKEVAIHKSCGPNKWLAIFVKDPAVCMKLIKARKWCSQTYFNHATNGDGNCGCVTDTHTDCARNNWNNEDPVRIYRIEGSSAETLSLASTGMDTTEAPSLGVAAIGACAGALLSVLTYVVLRRRPQQSGDYFLAN